MKTRIVVDSAASLYALDGVDFACVPLKVITDDAEYIDDGTMDAVGMAQALRTYKGKTSTSCPNVGDWLAAYEGADEVYAITITGTLSGSCNAAQLAAEDYMQENPGKRVFVLDSLSTGPEQQLLAEHIRDLLAQGKVDRAKAWIRQQHVSPARMVMIGDTLHDLEAAQAMGTGCILCATGHQSEADLRTAGVPVVTSFSQLEALLLEPAF